MITGYTPAPLTHDGNDSDIEITDGLPDTRSTSSGRRADGMALRSPSTAEDEGTRKEKGKSRELPAEPDGMVPANITSTLAPHHEQDDAFFTFAPTATNLFNPAPETRTYSIHLLIHGHADIHFFVSDGGLTGAMSARVLELAAERAAVMAHIDSLLALQRANNQNRAAVAWIKEWYREASGSR